MRDGSRASIKASKSLIWNAETADANRGLLARMVCCLPSTTTVRNPSVGFGFNNDAVISITFSFTNRCILSHISYVCKQKHPYFLNRAKFINIIWNLKNFKEIFYNPFQLNKKPPHFCGGSGGVCLRNLPDQIDVVLHTFDLTAMEQPASKLEHRIHLKNLIALCIKSRYVVATSVLKQVSSQIHFIIPL